MKSIRKHLKTGLIAAAAATAGLAAAQSEGGTNYVELRRIAEEAQTKAFAEKAQALLKVKQIGMPDRYEDPKSGYTMEVMRLDESGRPIYYETHNKNAAISTRASRVFPAGGAGFSLTGSGVTLHEWDGATARVSHLEFQGRVTAGDGAAMGNHATHVAGTMIAGGVFSVNSVPGALKGMSYQALLRSFDWNSDVSEAATEAAAGTPMRISNHSYGPINGWTGDDTNGWYWYGEPWLNAVEDTNFGQYGTQAVSWDELQYNAPYYLQVVSSGNERDDYPAFQPTWHLIWDLDENNWVWSDVVRNNDGNSMGFDSMAGMAVGKNCLTVGAADDVLSYSGAGSVVMSDFSSWGPTDDGRIKPDVVGNGVDVDSASDAGDNMYETMSGTSMSSPNVAGSLGLLVQRYRQSHGGVDARAATLKGVVVHTAREAGPSNGPDYRFGWGLMDTEGAANVITQDANNPNTIREDSIANGQSDTWYVTSDGTTPLKVTLCWTDPAGLAQTGLNVRTPRLKHDLDLRVIRGGTTYSPFKLDPNNPASAATTGDNNVDTVEVVTIPAPPAGLYAIVIDHDGTLAATQNYSLIVTGPKASPIMTNFTINGTWITGGNSTNGTVTINTPAPVGGVMFYPRMYPTNAFNIATPVIIPQGQTSKTFPIVGAGNVNANTAYSIWMHSGYSFVGRSGTLVPLRIKTMNLAPNPVQAGNNLSLTVTINGPAPAGGLVLTIDRSHAYWVMAPTTMTILQGQSSRTISIPIRAGAPAITGARITVIQPIQPSGTVSLQKLFNITP